MSKQTSIQWFAEKDTELTIQFLEGKLNQIQLAIEKMQCLEQAKQMHKEEIVEAYRSGRTDQQSGIDKWYNRSSSGYYEITYGGNNE